MKRFRKIWLGIVIFFTVLFIGYRLVEAVKADSSGPVISGGGDRLEVSIHDGEEILLGGITATDKKDGDVTDSIIVEKISNFYDENVRTVTYAAFDSDNHISKVEREIVYTDYNSPRFELTGALRFRAGEAVNVDKIVTAKDCLDGDISNKVKILTDTTINTRVTGFYRVVYEVTNSAGDNVKLPIDIEIYEPYNNEVELNLDRYLVYYEGSPIDYKDFLVSVRRGNLEYFFEGVDMKDPSVEEPLEGESAEDLQEEAGDETEETQDTQENTSAVIPKSRVRVESEVDTSKPGVYPVYYYYTHDNGNYTSEAKEVIYVVVE